MATLQSYLTATQRLLHDANAKYWTVATLTDAVNTACKRVVGDSRCNRQLQTVYLSGGLELYQYGGVSGALVTTAGSGYTSAPAVTFSAPPTGGTTATGTAVLLNGTVGQINVTNPGSGYTSAPTCTIAAPSAGVQAQATPSIISNKTLDTLNITVAWGTERIILRRISFTELQATIRSWTGYTQRPVYCASYGQTGWYIGPIPDMFYVSEWDTILTPDELVNLTDVSVIRTPYDECVPYYAAHIAKYQEQSYAEADKFLEIYTRKMKYAQSAIMMRQLRTPYGA